MYIKVNCAFECHTKCYHWERWHAKCARGITIFQIFYKPKGKIDLRVIERNGKCTHVMSDRVYLINFFLYYRHQLVALCHFVTCKRNETIGRVLYTLYGAIFLWENKSFCLKWKVISWYWICNWMKPNMFYIYIKNIDV